MPRFFCSALPQLGPVVTGASSVPTCRRLLMLDSFSQRPQVERVYRERVDHGARVEAGKHCSCERPERQDRQVPLVRRFKYGMSVYVYAQEPPHENEPNRYAYGRFFLSCIYRTACMV